MALWQAADAKKNAAKARESENAAVAAKANLESANQQLEQKRDEVETALARSLLRPLALQPGPLTDLEVGALCELASNPGDQLWKRFVIQALRDPMMTRRFKNRAGFALHAAVGLDSAKRLEIEWLLSAHLQDPSLAHAQQADLALIAVALGSLTPEAKAQLARTLIEALDKVKDPIAYQELAGA